MRHQLTAAALVILCGAGSAPDLLACGDKYIVPIRGTRFDRPSLPRDASILLFASDASDLSRVINKLSLATTFQKAGYRLTMVRSDADFTSALARGSWDLVLVDTADRPRIGDRGRDASGPAVLPVSYAGGDQLKLARQDYPALVKAPKNSRAFLDMIDTALEKHRSTQARKR